MKKLILTILILCAGGTARADTKIDPFLRQLYNAVNNVSPYNSLSAETLSGLSPMSLNGSVSRSSINGNAMVNVLIKTTSISGIKYFITENGGSVGTSINGIVTASIPLSLLNSLVQRQDCIDITLSKKLHILLDKSVPAVYGNIVHQGTGLPRSYAGRDVIIGVVDSGLDLTQTDIRYPDGSTKVISLWDQTTACSSSNCAPPQSYNYGEECTGYQINNNQCKEQDTEGHGTHVTGIIASGNNIYTGMAPNVMLVIVKTDMTEAHVIDGINYVFSIASKYNKPAVVNLSLGAQIGPHDDSTSTEQAIDGVVTQAPARAIVIAAGNDGGNSLHLGFTAAAAGSYASYFSVGSNPANPDTTQAYIDLWYDTTTPDLSFRLGVVSPSGVILAQTAWVPTGQTLPATDLGGNYGYASIDASAIAFGGSSSNEVVLGITNNGSSSINLTQSLSAYRYVLFIKNNDSTNAQRLNAWVSTDNSLFDTYTNTPPAGYTLVAGDNADTVSFPATAKYAIAAGSFVTKFSWTTMINGTSYYAYFPDTQPVGDLSFFSSRGPTPSPSITGQKPNLTAPGEVIVSALSTKASFPQQLITEDGTHVVLRGTSMACPHIAGAVALLFDRNNGLNITETIGLLENSATQDSATGTTPNNDWGYGKLNALALVQSATTTPSDTTPPVISAVTGKSTGTSTAQIMWSTDELSSSYVHYWSKAAPAQTFSTGTTTMTVAHIVNLKNLGSNTTYVYQVISADPDGNISVYPPNNGTDTFTTAKSSSSGCTCQQAGGRFNAGDMFPYLLLLLGWFVMIVFIRPGKCI